MENNKKKKKKKRRWLQTLLIALGTIFLVGFAYYRGIEFLEIMELKTIDFRFKARGIIQPQPNIALVTVDEKSLANEGKWPWERSKIARLVTKLSEAGARVIAFDIGFLEKDEHYLKAAWVIQEIKSQLEATNAMDASMERLFKAISQAADNDQLLAQAIKNAQSEVVLGYFFHMGYDGIGQLSPEELKAREADIINSSVVVDNLDLSGMPQATAPQPNIDIIAQSTPYCGYFNITPDFDGTVRRMGSIIMFNNNAYAPLGLMAIAAYMKTIPQLKADDLGLFYQIGNLSIPLDDYGNLIVNYRGPQKTFPHIPATDILNDQFDPIQVRDKIILVGATAIAIYDLRVSPFDQMFPGLEVHANVIDTVLKGDYIEKPDWIQLLDFVIIIVTGILLWVILPRCGVFLGAGVGVAVFSGYILVCYYFFVHQGLIINMVYPLLLIILQYTSITAFRYFVEIRQKQFIKNAFSTYLAPSIVKNLIEEPEKLVLGGEERVITAFFSDVQGFTGIAESLAPQELVELLNDFLTEMTDIILQHQGTVDKFEGDAIIAFFGAPYELENQALAAAKASIDMQKRLKQLRAMWEEKGKPQLHMRIGLCTGLAVVGNMGSKNRMDYTMMGDTVNTAARLEGVNKIYGTYMLVSHSARELIGDALVTRELDLVRVMGKKEPITIHELVGYPEDVEAHIRQAHDKYAQALARYRDREFDLAAQLFQEVLSIIPGDGPAKTMYQRCETYRQQPPPENWQGIFEMRMK